MKVEILGNLFNVTRFKKNMSTLSSAAALSVIELQAGCGDFKVVEMSGLQEEEFEGNNKIGMVPPPVGSQRIHIVKPGQHHCQ